MNARRRRVWRALFQRRRASLPSLVPESSAVVGAPIQPSGVPVVVGVESLPVFASHQKGLCCGLALTVLGLLGPATLPWAAAEPVALPVDLVPVAHTPKPLPDLPPHPSDGCPEVRTLRRSSLNRIFQFDTQPLGQRIPVLLLPGRAEEYQHSAWWKELHRAVLKDPRFDQDFKLYIYLYDSFQRLQQQTDDLVTELQARFPDSDATRPGVPGTKLLIVSYSLGGVIAREALSRTSVFHRVHGHIALGVPFHGSPIFDPDWFSTYMQPSNHSPIRRWEDRAVYRFYLWNKSNLIEGLRWNNFDGSKPKFDGEPPNNPPSRASRKPGEAVLAHGADPLVPLSAFKAKTLIYASYLNNRYIPEGIQSRMVRGVSQPGQVQPRWLKYYQATSKTTRKLPKALLGAVLPVYGLSVHWVMQFTNDQLAILPTFTPLSPKGRRTYLYRYNDGVVPLSSALFLPPRATPYEGDWSELAREVDVRQVRIFPNLDHLHLGEYTPTPSRLVTQDLMDPTPGRMSPNQWLLYDLFRLRDEMRVTPGAMAWQAEGAER